MRCEIWRGSPTLFHQALILSQIFNVSGVLQIEDASGLVCVSLHAVRGVHPIDVYADDPEWPETIQIVIDPEQRPRG